MLALILAAMLSQSPPEPRWRPVGRVGGVEIFVDARSINRSADSFDIDVRTLFGQPTTDGTRSAITRTRFNCTRQTWVRLSSRFFDTAGSLLEESTDSDSQERPARWDTTDGRIVDLFCPPRPGGGG